MIGGSGAGSNALIEAPSLAFNSSTVELNQGAAPTARNATISATGGDITGSISTHLLLTSTTNGQSSISAAGNINFSTLGATTLTGSAANTAFIQATGGSNGISFNSSGPNFGSITLNNNSNILAPGNIACYLAGASSINSGALTSYIQSTGGSVTINDTLTLNITAGATNA
ncbi:MAG: hypothetical protein HZB76_01285, partial [Chlamydiae bacterium]|nr:hypothetical protein [Chlamydiota bacterium]